MKAIAPANLGNVFKAEHYRLWRAFQEQFPLTAAVARQAAITDWLSATE
ncbi:MAG TPA: hypothetical protein VNG93_14155 [Candidatus Dormibacteraeota bacterium]|nr:hypothetical protein [Candidatus Dormibacteraeota bacterium]